MDNKTEIQVGSKGSKNSSRRWAAVALIAVACLVILAVAFGIVYTVNQKKYRANAEEYRNVMESIYQKSYYELSYNVGNMANTSNKLSVASGTVMQKELLADLSVYSTAASVSLSNLSEKEVDKGKTMKFINQTADYSKYLITKLNEGGTLSNEDKTTLTKISDAIFSVESGLKNMQKDVQKDGFSFVDNMKSQGGESIVISDNLQSDTIDYPSMIYDGPFSDSLSERDPKALKGEDISEMNGEKIVKKLLIGRNVTKIERQDGCKSFFETFNYTAQTDDGICYVTLSKKGGIPVSMRLLESSTSDLNYTGYNAETIAEKYLKDLGFNGMKAVWVSNYDNTFYINLAFTQNDVIAYPDLIKVQVNGTTGKVVGLESLNYIYNHTERNLESATILQSDVLNYVSTDLNVISTRKVLVPTKGNSEALAYEVYGTKNTDKYFVFVNATTGNEMKIMRVIDSESGMLLQ